MGAGGGVRLCVLLGRWCGGECLDVPVWVRCLYWSRVEVVWESGEGIALIHSGCNLVAVCFEGLDGLPDGGAGESELCREGFSGERRAELCL